MREGVDIIKFTEDEKFFSILFDAIPAAVLIVNASGRVCAINSSAKNIFNVKDSEVYLKKGGAVFHCVNAIIDSEACGTRESCRKCIVRNTAMKAIEGKSIKRAKGELIVEMNKKLKELYVLVSASPFDFNMEKLAIVILEDISNIVELQGLLPICSNCKNIYNKEGYWDRLEKYIEDHSEVKFSHDICPQCMKKLYPNTNL